MTTQIPLNLITDGAWYTLRDAALADGVNGILDAIDSFGVLDARWFVNSCHRGSPNTKTKKITYYPVWLLLVSEGVCDGVLEWLFTYDKIRYTCYIDVNSTYHGVSALIAAAAMAPAEDAHRVLSYLIKLCANVKYSSEPGGIVPTGSTALHAAAMRGDVRSMKVLLWGGADVNAKTCEGSTPLHLAARGGHLAACELLVSSNATLTSFAGRCLRRYPSEIANHKGHNETAKYLRKHMLMH